LGVVFEIVQGRLMKNISILGLGETGFACVEYFSKHNIPVTVMDSRESPPKLDELKNRYPNITVYVGGFVPEVLSRTDLLVLSPGIAKDDPNLLRYLKPKVDIVGDIELFAHELRVPLVAITGSNGKSTVTTLVGEMAKESGIKVAVGGNLGVPALTMLDKPMDLCVLELSSFQLETTYSLKPAVATILNISPDHMDRYRNVEEYFAAKERIYMHAAKIVVNRDDSLVYNYIPKNIPFISFGLEAPEEGSYGLSGGFLVKGKIPLLALSELKLFGRHNIANALAALALSESVNISLEAALRALKTFTGLKHRCEWIRTRENVVWINDSKGTNVGATQAAILGLAQDIGGKWVLIAGGIGKNADFSVLKPLVDQHCRAVVLLGEASDELEKLFLGPVSCVRASSMKEAVSLAAGLAQPEDGVLLSPACASFDMFKNFEDRGEHFRAEVLALK
jgi:UDP-N-acetylmuramoylalanine--D-glutamate ligase